MVGTLVAPATGKPLSPALSKPGAAPRPFTTHVGNRTSTRCSFVARVTSCIAGVAVGGFAVAARRARRVCRRNTSGARAEGGQSTKERPLFDFDWVPVLFSADTDSLWPQLFSPVLAVSFLSALLVWLQLPILGNASSSEVGIVGVLVSFATVFRTQQSYSRFWEGRSKLGMMMAGIVEAASITGVLLESGPCQDDSWRREQKAEVARLLRLYMREAAAFLRSASVTTAKRTEYWRDGDEVERDLSEILGSTLVKQTEHTEASATEARMLDAMAPRTRAPAVLQWLRRALQTAATEEKQDGALIAGSDASTRLLLLSQETTSALGTLQREFNACCKIATTPLPVQYVRISRLLRFVFVFACPLLLANKLGWSCVLFCGLLAFGYHAIDAVGLALSNPFVGKLGEATLDGRFVAAVCTDVDALLLTEAEAFSQTQLVAQHRGLNGRELEQQRNVEKEKKQNERMVEEEDDTVLQRALQQALQEAWHDRRVHMNYSQSEHSLGAKLQNNCQTDLCCDAGSSSRKECNITKSKLVPVACCSSLSVANADCQNQWHASHQL